MTTNNIQGNAPKFVRNMAGDVELNIYDEIGFWGVDQNDFNRELKSLNGEPLTVRISSNGGAVDDAIAMYNMLKSYSGTVTTINDSIAASAATLIFLAGDVRKASSMSSFMTHKPMAGFYGNTDEVVEFNSMLEHYNGVILNSYIAGGIDETTAATLINSGDYWFNAEAALEMGFISEMTDAEPVQNSVDLTKFANVPDFVLNSNSKTSATVQAVAASVKKPENQKTEVPIMADENAVSTADHEQAVADAEKKGFVDALDRVNKVNALESRKGREATADKLLATASMTVEQIDDILQTMPAAQVAPVLDLSDDLGDLSANDDAGDKPVDKVANFAASIGKVK